MTSAISITAALFIGLLFGFSLGTKSKQEKETAASYAKLQQRLDALEQRIQNDNATNFRAHSFNTMCLQQCLIALRSYMLAMKRNAVEQQRFEEAQECLNVINNMESLINFSNKQ